MTEFTRKRFIKMAGALLSGGALGSLIPTPGDSEEERPLWEMGVDPGSPEGDHGVRWTAVASEQYEQYRPGWPLQVDGIRNRIVIEYHDPVYARGWVSRAMAVDTESEARFGSRLMTLNATTDPHITTKEAAEMLAQEILSDYAWPQSGTEIQINVEAGRTAESAEELADAFQQMSVVAADTGASLEDFLKKIEEYEEGLKRIQRARQAQARLRPHLPFTDIRWGSYER